MSKVECYGAFPGGDPRDFTPDPECSTEAEREAHRRACARGHEFDETNTIREGNQRKCRTCRNAGLRARRALARLDRVSAPDRRRE